MLPAIVKDASQKGYCPHVRVLMEVFALDLIG